MAKRSSRTLAVIVHADVVGSTTLVQRDEKLAHERIRDAFRRYSKTIDAYGGITHEVRGDALLAEFKRASDAIAASLAFQAGNARSNALLQDDVRPELRIGISLGEVIIADGTLTGTDVVLAQRLEQLTPPGEVSVSQAVYQSVPRRLPFEWRDLGEREVKGFDEPVRVYGVAPLAGEAIPGPESGAGGRAAARRRRLGLAAAAVLVAGGGFAAWMIERPAVVEPAAVDRMAFPLPDKPSIAVLPFDSSQGAPEHAYFADGITQDLITDLSKVSGLFVIARNSTFAYRGTHPDVRRVAEDLGVRYVLEGGVRRTGDRVRINVRLVDATSGGQVWAERYDGGLEDVFALQDKVTSNIVTALAVELTGDGVRRADRESTRNAAAYDAFLRGWEHFLRQTPEHFHAAISDFERAAALDPEYGRAYAALAATYWEIWKRFWHETVNLAKSNDARARAEEYLAMAMPRATPLALRVAAEMAAQSGDHDRALADAERAIAIDPNDADGYVVLARVLTLAGFPGRALKSVERAMRLNPRYPASYLYQLGLAQFGLERFEEAADSLAKAAALNPDDRWSLRLLLATYGHLERREDVRKVLEAIEGAPLRGMQEYYDPLTIRSSAFWHPFKNPADAERLADGLRWAGVPD